MKTLGNLLWFLLCGLWSAIAWFIIGCIWCITIIGIPGGLQCFKFAGLALFPFKKEVCYGGGGMSFLANLIWICLFGLWLAIGYFCLGIIFCITIIGIPFGKQCFKLARLALMPFGAEIVDIY